VTERAKCRLAASISPSARRIVVRLRGRYGRAAYLLQGGHTDAHDFRAGKAHRDDAGWQLGHRRGDGYEWDADADHGAGFGG
jgi:hypothetical protein